MADSDFSPPRSRRRQLGAYYTPGPIVRYMLRSCFDGPLAPRLNQKGDPLRILDPSCGDGAFIVGAMHELLQRKFGCRRTIMQEDGKPSVEPLREVVLPHLFGVDVDPLALSALLTRLETEANFVSGVTQSSHQGFMSNFQVGDALTGCGFREAQQSSPDEAALHWRTAFPQVARGGGFDLVIGNPPYLREKGAQQLFLRLSRSELGRRWRSPRMDLWHYFVHRGLDLLRPSGVLCFIVSGYWMAARSAEPMIRRLQEETTVREVVLFGDAPIFDGVTGRHMILQVQKVKELSPCRVRDLSGLDDRATVVKELSQDQIEHEAGRSWLIPQASLITGCRFTPRGGEGRPSTGAWTRLGELFDVRQGIAENPPFVTRAAREEFGDQLRIGSGVFVLTAEELAELQLTQAENDLLRPYYAANAIRRYQLPPDPKYWILYLTKQTAPHVEHLPNIARHLAPFRPILERRREVRRGTINWWHLHWPREERLFVEQRILAVQMTRQPCFAYVEQPTFVNFSVNVIRCRGESHLTLPAVTALLNSTWAAQWFSQHAKRRGVAFDISGSLLRDFPLPQLDKLTAGRLHALCLRRQEIRDSSIKSAAADELESQIDELVAEHQRVLPQ